MSRASHGPAAVCGDESGPGDGGLEVVRSVNHHLHPVLPRVVGGHSQPAVLAPPHCLLPVNSHGRNYKLVSKLVDCFKMN